MRKFNRILKSLLVLGLIFPGVVIAQDRWELVVTSKEGFWYIDTESNIMLSPGRYLFWEKFYPFGSLRQKFIETFKRATNVDKFAYIIGRHEVDCSTMKERVHSLTYYTDDGKVIYHDIRKLSEWYDTPPESVGEIVLKKVCAKEYDAKEM